MHVDHILTYDELPRACIDECSSSGDVSDAVSYWRKELAFTVNRRRTIDCLAGYGAWPRGGFDDNGRPGLMFTSNETLAERVLWLACGNFSEYLDWCEENGRDPAAPDNDPPCGSDIFALE